MDPPLKALLDLVNRLDDLIHESKSVPLSDKVQFEKEPAYDILDAMREKIAEIREALHVAGVGESALAIWGPDPPAPAERPDDAEPIRSLPLVDKLDDFVHAAKPVPLTNQVRVDKEAIYNILDEIRAAFPEDFKRASERGLQGAPLDRESARAIYWQGEDACIDVLLRLSKAAGTT